MKLILSLLIICASAMAQANIVGSGRVSGNVNIGTATNSAAGGGGGNVTYDTSAKSSPGLGVETVTISITIGNNNNRCLIVMAGAGDGTIGDRTVDSVSSSVDGAFTHVASSDADDATFYRVEAWRLVNPTAGAHTITVDYGGAAACDQAMAFAISLYNVDQTTPVGTPTVASGTAATATAAVTLGSDDMAVGGLSTDSGSTITVTVGTERQEEESVLGDSSYAMASNTGTGSISITWDLVSPNLYSISVIPVNGAP